MLKHAFIQSAQKKKLHQRDGLSSRVNDVEAHALLLELATELFLSSRKFRRVIALELDPESHSGDPDPEIGRPWSRFTSGMSRMPRKRVTLQKTPVSKLLLLIALEPVSLWLGVVV